MRTEQQIRDAALTVTANRSFGGTLAAELIALMVATGMIVNKRGWIYWTVQGAPGKPIAHGWGQMIASLTRHSWNGRDLVAEMSKRSVTEQAIAEDAERAERDKTIAVTFERLGRSRDLVTRIDRTYLDDVDEFARQMHAFARTRVASRYFEVEVDVERGVVLVEGGRFGRGTFPVPAA